MFKDFEVIIAKIEALKLRLEILTIKMAKQGNDAPITIMPVKRRGRS